jgi:hypothetical protein
MPNSPNGGWKGWVAGPWAVRARRGDLSRNAQPAEVQGKVLVELLRQAKDTAFGKDHDLASVLGIEDPKARAEAFRNAVPVRDYEGLKPYVERMVDGERDVLWPGLHKYFCKTSGTTSGAKFIPLTEESLHNHIGSARRALLHHLARTGSAEFVGGKMIFLQGSPSLTETKGGVPLGRLSGIVAHHIPQYLQRNRMPSWETNTIEDWETKVDAVVAETVGEDLRLISGIPSWVQMYFERLLEHTGAKNVLEVFPNFSLFVVGGVAYGPYAERFKELIGAEVPRVEIYPASEGFIAYQDGEFGEGLLVNADDGLYLEFIPADEYGGPDARRLGLGEVELGVNYAVVVTSNAGLWGYDLGDTVRFVSLSPARLVVTGRIKHFTSAFGEHVIAEEVEAAMEAAVGKIGGQVVEFHVAPEVSPEEGLPHHEWFVEFAETPEDLHRFATALDSALQERNPYYRDLIAGSVLRPAVLTTLQGGAFRNAMARRGKLGGQNKVPRLANDRALANQLKTDD